VRPWRALIAAAGLTAACHYGAQEMPGVIHYGDGDFLLSGSAAPPPDAAPWKSVDLPDRWADSRAGTRSPGWYRFRFRISQAPTEPWMLYVPAWTGGGEVFLDHALLARLQTQDAEHFVRWVRPHAFPIPPSQLHVGWNTLHLRVAPAADHTHLSSIWLGPDRALRPIYEARHFWAYTSAQITALITMIVALFVIVIWLRRRLAFDFGLFGLAAFLWGLRTTSIVIEVYPHSLWLPWRVLHYTATGGFAVSMALFMLRFAGIRRRWLERALVAYWPIGPAVLAIGGLPVHDSVDRWYQSGLLVIAALTLVVTLYAGWQQRTPAALALCGAVLLSLAFGVHDFMLSQGFLSAEGVYLLHFGAAGLLLVVGALLADRFVRGLRETERSSEVLAARVAQRERELTANYDRLRLLERDRAIADERQRIMQDMHDGLGSQLLTSLAAVERGALDPKGMAQVLREAVDDMRLAIDTLSPEREGLLEALGNLRYRLEPRFRAAGIALTFERRDLPEQLDIAPEHALQILRVLQESLTNVLKHARAHEVRVTVALDGTPPRFILEVADDGGGFDPGVARPGRGISGMRRRAQQIGVALELASDAHGTRVSLAYPLPLQR